MHARAHAHTPTHTHTLPRWSNGKESTCVQARTHAINPPASSGDAGLIPGSGRSPGEGNGNPLQYSCLGNPKDRGDSWAIVHGVTKSQTQLSNTTTTPGPTATHIWASHGSYRGSPSSVTILGDLKLLQHGPRTLFLLLKTWPIDPVYGPML